MRWVSLAALSRVACAWPAIPVAYLSPDNGVVDAPSNTDSPSETGAHARFNTPASAAEVKRAAWVDRRPCDESFAPCDSMFRIRAAPT